MNDINEIEKIILGTIMAIPDLQDKILLSISPDLFTSLQNKSICKSMFDLRKEKSKIDIITITQSFSKDELQSIGGAYYISSLTSKVASGYGWESHILLLKENYIRTQLINLFSKEINNLTNKLNDIQDTYTNVKTNIDKMFEFSAKDFTHISEIMEERINDYERASLNDSSVIGINTGHSSINSITSGWQNGDLIILAARPSMGKTALSLFFAKHTAFNNENVLYFSLEMPARRLSDRLLSLLINVNSQKLQSGKMDDYEWDKLSNLWLKYKDANLYINDESSLSVEDIYHACIVKSSDIKIGLIIIDYLQLIKPPLGNASTNDKIGYVSRTLKEIAKKIDCPVIVLSQLSREVERRPNKRPILSDLRDSGNIEQDADIVMFAYRPEYYGYNEDLEGNDTRNLIELIFAKNRNGETGYTNMYKNADWSYIGEFRYEEYKSFNMPF